VKELALLYETFNESLRNFVHRTRNRLIAVPNRELLHGIKDTMVEIVQSVYQGASLLCHNASCCSLQWPLLEMVTLC